MSNEKKGISEGSLLSTLLLVAFIVLKLCNVIDWSWWWVLSPFWIPLALGVLGLVLYIGYKMVVKEKPKKSRWQQRMEEMQAQHKQMQERQKHFN